MVGVVGSHGQLTQRKIWRNPRTKYKRSINVFPVTHVALIGRCDCTQLLQFFAQSLIGSPLPSPALPVYTRPSLLLSKIAQFVQGTKCAQCCHAYSMHSCIYVFIHIYYIYIYVYILPANIHWLPNIQRGNHFSSLTLSPLCTPSLLHSWSPTLSRPRSCLRILPMQMFQVLVLACTNPDYCVPSSGHIVEKLNNWIKNCKTEWILKYT